MISTAWIEEVSVKGDHWTYSQRVRFARDLVINGTLDPIVPFDGGPILIRDRERGDVLSTDATMKFFAARNGCSRRYWQTSSSYNFV